MVIRIGGLASGMDIDSIVNDLMRVERTRVDKVTQDKTLLEWTREAYNDINKKFADFVLSTRQSFGLTHTSGGTIVNRSVSSFDWIKSAAIGDSGIADIKARSNAVNGNYRLNVRSLAANWSAASSSSISIGDTSNIKDQFGLMDDSIEFTITTKEGAKTKTFTIETSSSLHEVVKELNTSDLGITAIYDATIDRFFLQTEETGLESTIKIEDSSGFISCLKLESGVTGKVESGVEYHGKNAELDFGGATNITMSSNQFTINNIDINIIAEGETTIHVSTDENAIVNKVKDFVNQYNELMDELNNVLGQKQYRDYRPLTQEQKKEMSDKEIELWEERAKSGLLRNDFLVTRTMQSMRSGLYEKVLDVTGVYSQLTEIGIQTERYTSGSMGGKLEINEDQLRDAIREDVDGVINLLFKEPSKDISDPKEKREKTGLIGRLYGDMVVGMKEIIAKAGPGENSQIFRSINTTMLLDFVTKHSSVSMLDDNIMDYDKRLFELERRLMDKENQYWAKFSAMETALNKMYSQSDWLYQQFSQM